MAEPVQPYVRRAQDELVTEGASVAAVVVTWNRRELLAACLDALAAQERTPERIYVWDNASSDGTREWLKERAATDERLVVLRSEENLGGAGGFHHGLRRAWEDGYDWLWLMDDDTICRPDSLHELLAAVEAYPTAEQPRLVASVVEWRDGLPHTMNNPGLRFNSRENRDRTYACAQHGHLLIRQTTFVSVCLHRTAVAACGLPIAEYFLWFDDIEYTIRVCSRFPGIVAPRSRVEHRTTALHTAGDAPPAKFYFAVRNGLWTWRSNHDLSVWERRMFGLSVVRGMLAYCLRRWYVPARWYWVFKGVCRGLFTRPRRIVTGLGDA